jgi:predicted aspartyl protease
LAPIVDVSRRRFLTLGASSLAFASIVARAQGVQPRRVAPPSQLVPQSSAASSATPLPEPAASSVAAATDAARHLRVSVRIDGQGPYRFVVDTGADRTVLATDVAADLGLMHGNRVMLEGVVRAVAAETVAIHELSFGSIKCGQLNVPILPRSMLEADGYLGLDTLDGHRVTFDFKHHTLQVSKPRSRLAAFWLPQHEARIRTVGTSGHLRALDCTVDGVIAAAFIDSGAEVSAGNPSLLAALGARNRTYSDAGTIPLFGVTGGETLGNVTIVNKIKLMDVEFTACPLVIADFQIFDVWGLRQHPALLIGMNLLRQFSKVSIDYGLKELRFDLARLGLAQPT